MSNSPDRRVVVVTGANEGIGHHLLIALANDGYRVAGLDVNGENLRPLQESHPDRVRFYECDVTTDDVEAAIDAVVDEWGRVDVLVNNAAILNFGFFEDQTDEDLRRAFEVNYFGYVRTIRAVLPHMRARNGGIIHNVCSGVASAGHPGLTGYGSTKGAIEGLVRSLRMELQRENVACTVMYPPMTNTRSARTLGYPEYVMRDPADVGRKLAEKIESTDSVVVTDWFTKIGMALVRRFPFIARKGTERFLEEREATVEGKVSQNSR